MKAGRKPQGDRAMTHAERQARVRERKATQEAQVDVWFQQITLAPTIREARKIAAAALIHRAKIIAGA